MITSALAEYVLRKGMPFDIRVVDIAVAFPTHGDGDQKASANPELIAGTVIGCIVLCVGGALLMRRLRSSAPKAGQTGRLGESIELHSLPVVREGELEARLEGDEYAVISYFRAATQDMLSRQRGDIS